VRAARQQLLLQSGAAVPPRSPAFRWPPHEALLGAQRHLVADLALARPEGQTYARALAKGLIARLEEAVRDAEARGHEAEVSAEAEGSASGIRLAQQLTLAQVDGSLLEVYAELLSGASGSR
jgi:VIT1/CCC1 family predicted Fe2+/Mn2+ transporter